MCANFDALTPPNGREHEPINELPYIALRVDQPMSAVKKRGVDSRYYGGG